MWNGRDLFHLLSPSYGKGKERFLQMRAVVVDSSGRMALQEAPDPSPGPGEILLSVAATAVNRADLLQRWGLYPSPPGASPFLGLEAAGTVVQAGEGCSRFAPGDRGMALLAGGGYASLVVVPEVQVLPLPSSWSFFQGAAFPEAFATAWLNLFLLGRGSRGETALILAAASGVGTAALQLCRERGMRALGTCGTEEKAAACRSLGAEVLWIRSEGDLPGFIQLHTEGRGVDVLLDCVGGSSLADHLSCLGLGGRLLLIGLMGGRTAEIDLGRVLARRLSIQGSTLRPLAPQEKGRVLQTLWEACGDSLENGRILPAIDRVLALEEAEEAHRVVAENLNVGKVVLAVSGG